VVKIPLTGALLATAILTLTGGDAGASQSCTCVPSRHANSKSARHAPARIVQPASDAGAEYAQSYYDYRSASRVGEVVQVLYPAERRALPWRVVPDDVNIHFYRDRVSYHEAPLPYQAGYGPAGYYGPPANYYGVPTGYYGPPPGDYGMRVNDQGFDGGVGYGMDGGGGGGGYGGQAFIYGGQRGGQNAPSNSGGVNLPAGYGRDMYGNWQGPVPPHPPGKSN
jgi:hypothetical protein